MNDEGDKMKVLISGGTGLVGTALCQALVQRGYTIILLTRNKKKISQLPYEAVIWNDLHKPETIKKLSDISTIIHLAGAGVADKRWSASYKKQIFTSRVDTAKQLSQLSYALKDSIKTFISTSGVNFYGYDAEKVFTETDLAGNSFLSDVCVDWEKAVQVPPSCRKVIFRLGMVLSDKGGALQKMLPAFKFYLGGRLSSGQQAMSWIDIEDLINIYIHGLEQPLEGVYNTVAPEVITNKTFTKKLAKTLKVFAILPVPAFILKLLLGEMSELLLYGQKVSSKKIQDTGFTFKYPHLTNSLSKRIFKKINV